LHLVSEKDLNSGISCRNQPMIWDLVPRDSEGKQALRRVVPDGTLRDLNSLPRRYWEAKDTKAPESLFAPFVRGT
jgi:hypothetical protein